MSLLQAIFLGLLQGITEFLPISSSGHLVLAETFLGLHVDELKDFDVMLHVGTLLAILIYFRRDILNVKWWPWLILASLPATLVGVTLEDKMDALFRGAESVAFFLIFVGLLFFIPQRKNNQKLTWWRALLMGCGQAIAIIPGVSRSGASIFTGMQLGLNREEAARFSFLMGSIAIAGAGLLKALKMTDLALPTSVLLAGFLAAFLSSLFAASFMMKFLKHHSFKAFGVYRVLLGVTLLIVLNFFISEASATLSVTQQSSETSTQTQLPSEKLDFKTGNVTLIKGAYSALGMDFSQTTDSGTLVLKMEWPSNESFSVLPTTMPTLPFTFDQSLFEGLYSERLQAPVLPIFTFISKAENQYARWDAQTFKITLTHFEVNDETISLEGSYTAEFIEASVEGSFHLSRIPLNIMLVD